MERLGNNMLVKGYDEAGQNLDDLSERTITFRDGSFELCILNMYSALVVYTAYCALQIVRLTLPGASSQC